MNKWLKWGGYGLLALVVACIPVYWWLFGESHKAAAGSYAIDLAEVRRLADTQGGEKPLQLRVETVAHVSPPKVFVVAGDGWHSIDLPISSYELVSRDHTAVVETALSAEVAKSMGATNFDGAAYARMNDAIGRAALIVVTHEHPDHIGGLLAQPDLKQRLAVTRLTREQVAELKPNLGAGSFAPLHLPSNLFEKYQPLDYGRYLALAPGIVLIKSPGHTPGSQMIYVRRADGVEFLFLGDVAWIMRNVEMQREKARLVDWVASENRSEVREELAGLHELHVAHPEIHMVPGHDAAAIDSLVRNGLLVRGF
jgi:glyoxylase-like metal-dependent hydrolase (beta-lactamase superfamily II)